MLDLSEKTVVVTGAASGMGLATAEAMVGAGATVIGADVKPLPDLAQTDGGGELHTASCDVTDEDQVAALVRDAAGLTGTIDVLCNCAGIFPTAPLVETSVAEFQRVIDVNLLGTFLPCKHALPLMKAAGGGSVINWGSTNSFVANELCGAYCATKGAVLMLTKAIAVEHGPDNIRANSICPGWVETPMNDKFVVDLGGAAAAEDWVRSEQPLGKVFPDEVAALAVFLASDVARTISGAAYMIDSGLTAK